MLAMVIGAIITIVAAVIAMFLILIAINIALVVKLRSIIPSSPVQGRRPHPTARPAARTAGDNYPEPPRN
jgi:hypothetical protein